MLSFAIPHQCPGTDKQQTINHFITYSVITAKPELSYTSVVSTIRLYPVTSGPHEGSTFVEWSGNFSSDADAGKSFRSSSNLLHITAANVCR
jgi:hypothetical protein